tara:strand:+ start:5172 stop:6359 length:1188 start_codon:yes stop_codon:yes gene_type:complete
MLINKKSFTLTKILLVLYIFRFVIIAGSESYSGMFNFIGELVVLAFFVDVTAMKSRINWSNFRTIVPYLIFLFLMLFSVIWYPKGSEYIFDHFTKYLLFFICFFVVASTNNFDFLFYAIILGCATIFVVGYDEILEYTLQPVNRRFTFNTIDEEGGINPNVLAFYCNISIAFLIYKYRLINKKHVKLGILCLIGTFVLFIVFVTLSRKGLIGILIMFLFFLLSGKKLNLRFKILSILISSTIIFFLMQNFELPVLNRFISTINLFEGSKNIGQSDHERSFLILESISFWKESPIFGNGIKHFENNSVLGLYTHTNYMELLVNYGLVGLLLFYSPIITRLRTLYTYFNHFHIQIKFFFFILIFILISDFAMVSYYNVVYLFLLSVVLGYDFNFKGK